MLFNLYPFVAAENTQVSGFLLEAAATHGELVVITAWFDSGFCRCPGSDDDDDGWLVGWLVDCWLHSEDLYFYSSTTATIAYIFIHLPTDRLQYLASRDTKAKAAAAAVREEAEDGSISI